MTSRKTTYTLRIDRHEVRLRHTAAGLQVRLARGTVVAVEGAPALPVRTLHIALPAGHKAHALSARVLSVEPLTRANARVIPFIEVEDDSPAIRPLVSASPELCEKAFQRGRHRPAWLAGTTVLGEIPVATVMVQAVRFGPARELELIREIEITVQHKAVKAPAVCRPHSFMLQQHALARSLVVNPSLVDEHPHPQLPPLNVSALNQDLRLPLEAHYEPTDPLYVGYPDTGRAGPLHEVGNSNTWTYLPAQIDYLIVTDHRRWKPTGTVEEQINDQPSDPPPPTTLRADFERLADAKRARGWRVHTVTLSDIVAGDYGDYASNARDVQEVLRNFLKDVVSRCNVGYVLLGGDHTVIPPRLFCGRLKDPMAKVSLGGDGIPTEETPGEGQYAWNADGQLLMHIDSNAWDLDDGEMPFLTMDRSGQYVPQIFSDPDHSAFGWYYCTDSTYTTLSTDLTLYVCAKGLSAAQVADDKPHWYMRLKNLIPSDLYYASLYAEVYDQPGKHDWDRLGNGFYGQFYEDEEGQVVDLDGGSLHRDVHVGRAPVSTPAEAVAFIDKVFAYEDAPAQPDKQRFNNMVFAAINLDSYDYMEPILDAEGKPLNYSEVPTLGSHQYVPDEDNGRAILYAAALRKNYSEQGKLYAYPTDNVKDRTEILHNDDSTSGTGWYFATSYGDPSSVSQIPTNWVVVYTNKANHGNILTPKSFGYDILPDELSSSVQDSEDLYEYVQDNFPLVTVDRLYTDDSGVTNNREEVHRLTDVALLEMLKAGPNVFTVAGHGGRYGANNLLYSSEKPDDLPHVEQLENAGKPFIAFLRSCFTGAFDFDNSLGEELVTAADKGAVAYIGFSNLSAAPTNDDLRDGFFESLHTLRHLGAIFDSLKMYVDASPSSRAHLYTINLLGDPTMVVYRDESDVQPYYIGNSHTKELHRSTCLWAEQIWVGHQVEFNTLNEGREEGYDGCFYCLREYHTR